MIHEEWKLQKKISRWLGIYTQGKVLSGCIVDENGLIESSFVWFADSIEEDIIAVVNHFNISTVLGGNLYDSILNKIVPYVEVPVIRIHDNNSYRIFSKKDDRKLNLPVWMILGDKEAIIADRHAMGGDLELDQGTPKPLFLHKISGGAFNKEELEELLTLKHMVPWYDGNHSRHPLPLFAAKRAYDRNPLRYNDLPKLSFDWFNHVWFA